MLTKEIQQHLAEEQESDLPDSRQFLSQSGSVFSQQLPLEVNIKTKKQNKNRVDERAEILKNLDPQVFQDCDFSSNHQNYNFQTDQTDNVSGRGSFMIDQTSSYIDKNAKNKKQNKATVPATQNTTMNTGELIADHNQKQYLVTETNSLPTQAIAKQRAGSNPRAGRHLMRLNNAKNTPQLHQQTGVAGGNSNTYENDYQIMMHDESTDIRLLNGKRHFGLEAAGSFINKKRVQRNNTTASSTVLQHVASQRRNQQLGLSQQRRLTTTISAANKMQQQRKLRSTQQQVFRKNKQQQPTIGQQIMLLQQSLNSNVRQQHPLSQQNNFDRITKEKTGLDDEEPIFDFQAQRLNQTQFTNGSKGQQSMLIKVDSASGQDAFSNCDGQPADGRVSQQQTRQQTQEKRIRNLQAKIQSKRNSSFLRPGTGYQIRSSNTGVSKAYRHQPSTNQDLFSQISGNPHHHMDQNSNVLRKNESDIFGRKQNAFMSLTSNKSQRINVQNQPRRNQQNYSFMPMKEDVLSERQVGAGLGKMKIQNLNQVSTSSFVISDTRGDTNTYINANSKNLSPNHSSVNKLDRVTALSSKEEEAILSLNMQPTSHQKPGHRFTAQKKPLVEKAKIQKPKKQQLILFTGGDQVKIEVPSVVDQQPQQASKRRIGLKSQTATSYQTQQPHGQVAHSMTNARKWITANHRRDQYQPQQQVKSSLKDDSINNTSCRNQDLNMPEIRGNRQLLEATKSHKNSSHLLINDQQRHAARAYSSSMRSKQHSKLSTPQLQQQFIPAVDDYAVEQVKSLLDQTNMHDTPSLSRGDDISQMECEELINQGSVQHIQNQVSLCANVYVNQLIEGCSPVALQGHGAKVHQRIEYFEPTELTYLTQQVRNLEITNDDYMKREKLNLSQQSSSILRTNENNSANDQRSLSNKKKHVSIREESKLRTVSVNSQSQNGSANILIKNSLVPVTLTKPQHTHQHRFHQNCGHTQLDKNSDSQRSRGVRHNKSIGSLNSGRSAPKFVGNKNISLTKMPLSQADMNVLTRIQHETKAVDKRIKNNKSRITSVYGNSRKSPDVLVQKGSISDYNPPTDYKKPGNVARMHQSVIGPSPIDCNKCKKRQTLEENKSSCAVCNSSGKIEAGGFIVTKGSSVKGGNLWSSRLGADTLSQHSMFCSTHKKQKSTGHNSVSRMSTNSNYKKILNRKFKISRDLTKYTKKLDYKQSERKLMMFSKSAKGKHLTTMRQRAELVSQQETKWTKEREALKNTDWEDSDLYDAFKESKTLRKPIEQVLQRFAALKTVTAYKMYTDVELQYYMQLIEKKHCKINSEEVKEENNDQIVLEYFNRSLYTLQALTKLLKIDFHYDRLFKKYETDYKVDTVLTLMTRSRKMYQAIEMILTIIKLIEKLKTFTEKSSDNPSSAGVTRKIVKNPAMVKNLKARIRVHIKSFLSQHTLFPVQFRYDGIDQLTFLKTSTNPDGRSESHLSGESRIINLRLGESSRNSVKSGRSSALSQKSQKSQKKTGSFTGKGGKGKKLIRPISKTVRQSPSRKSLNNKISSSITSQKSGKQPETITNSVQ